MAFYDVTWINSDTLEEIDSVFEVSDHVPPEDVLICLQYEALNRVFAYVSIRIIRYARRDTPCPTS